VKYNWKRRTYLVHWRRGRWWCDGWPMLPPLLCSFSDFLVRLRRSQWLCDGWPMLPPLLCSFSGFLSVFVLLFLSLCLLVLPTFFSWVLSLFLVQLLLKMELWSCCWRWSSGAATEDEVEGVLQDYNGLTFCFSLLFVRPPVFFRPCSLVFPPGFCGALSVRSSPVLCGLSLAFIKPGNAMQLPLDNEATDRCCRRRIVGSWQGSGSWMKKAMNSFLWNGAV